MDKAERKKIMKEYRKLTSEMEDCVALGKSLPVVALRQMKKIAAKFGKMPDTPDLLPGTQHAFEKMLNKFVDECMEDADDERYLKQIFAKKTYGPDWLPFFLT